VFYTVIRRVTRVEARKKRANSLAAPISSESHAAAN
jgi:hypothetical protein